MTRWVVSALIKQSRRLGNSGSPYATVTLVDAKDRRVREKQKTKTHKDGGNAAIWNAYVEFKGKEALSDDEIATHKLFVGVRLKSWTGTTKVGDVKIDLKDFKGSKDNSYKWYDIFGEGDAGQFCGEVEVAINVVDADKDTSSSGKNGETRGKKDMGERRMSFKERLERQSLVEYEDKNASETPRKPEEIEGYLWKRGSLKKNWKRRYFKIFEWDGLSYKLYYFESKVASKDLAKAKNFVLVKPECEIMPCDIDGKENAFKITGGRGKDARDFYLQARGAGEMRKWIDQLAALREKMSASIKMQRKIASTTGAHEFVALPIVHRGKLFRNDGDAVGPRWVVLHASTTSSDNGAATKNTGGEDDEDTRAAILVYEKKGEKYCEMFVDLSDATVGTEADGGTFYVSAVSGARVIFRGVEDDDAARRSVITDWVIKLKQCGCRRDHPDPSPVRKEYLHTIRKRFSSERKRKKSVAEKKEEKRKEEVSQEDKIRAFVNKVWTKIRTPIDKVAELPRNADASKVLETCVHDFHPPGIDLAGSPSSMMPPLRSSSSLSSSSSSSSASKSSPLRKLRRKSSWKPHAGFMRFRKLMQRRLHFALDAFACDTIETVREAVKENGIAASVPKIAALVVDDRAKKAISHLIPVKTIEALIGADAGCVNIKDDSRESLPCGVYVLSGSRRSVEALAKDFPPGAPEKARYKARFVVIFTERPDTSDPVIRRTLHRLLATNEAFRNRLAAALQVLYCVALPINECGAYCGCQVQAEKLMASPRDVVDGRGKPNPLVDRVFSLLVGMNEWPVFRYDARSPLARSFAGALDKRIKAYVGKTNDWWYRGALTSEPDPTMLIVDRAFDIASPLMRNSALQGAMFDHLSAEDLKGMPFASGYESDRVYDIFRWLRPAKAARKARKMVDLFKKGGRGLKSEAECEAATYYETIARRCIKAAGGESLYDGQVELHQQIASGFVPSRGGALDCPSEEKLHDHIIRQLGDNACLIEDEDDENEDRCRSSSGASKSSTLSRSNASVLSSLVEQTEALFVFAYFWRTLLRTGKLPRDDEANAFGTHLFAELRDVVSGLNKDTLLAEFKEYPELARRLLRSYDSGEFVPKTYHVRGGKTENLESIAAGIKHVDAEWLHELNRDALKGGFFSKFNTETMIKKAVDLKLPTLFDVDCKLRLASAEMRAKANEGNLSYQSRIASAFENLANGHLDDDDFPCVTPRPSIPGQKVKPRTIILVIGGISWFEFLQLTASARQLEHPVTVISTRFFNGASDFLSVAKRLPASSE